MDKNELDGILDEATVNYNASKAVKDHECNMEDEIIKDAIDRYYDADQKEKEGKKEKSMIREDIDEVLSRTNVSGMMVFSGNVHKLQVVEKHSYSLNQAKCDSDHDFNVAFCRGKLAGINHKITLDIVPAELQQVIQALTAAGLTHVVSDIKREWVFSGNAEDSRKLMESVEEVNLKDFINDYTSLQISAKK